jgi:hypothetical protein
MKKQSRILLMVLMVIALIISIVQMVKSSSMEFGYEPVVVSRNDLEKLIQFTSPRDINYPERIFTRDQYIIISERDKGIHIIDNTNPSAPVNLGFIVVPACREVAIKGNIIYAQNATDLIAIDALNFSSPVVTSRISEVFPELLPPDETYIPTKYQKFNRPSNTVIIDWIKK